MRLQLGDETGDGFIRPKLKYRKDLGRWGCGRRASFYKEATQVSARFFFFFFAWFYLKVYVVSDLFPDVNLNFYASATDLFTAWCYCLCCHCCLSFFLCCHRCVFMCKQINWCWQILILLIFSLYYKVESRHRSTGETPLIRAAAGGHLKVVEFLINEYKADVNAADAEVSH